MAAGDKYIKKTNTILSTEQVLRSLVQQDASGKPFLKTNAAGLPVCPAITGFAEYYHTSSSVMLEWNNNGETLFDVYYGPAPLAAPDANTPATTTSATNGKVISGLNTGSDYDFYVRSSCGGLWSSILTIKTNNNSIVQSFLDKATADGYTLPTAPKIAIYNAAWDYSDAQGLTNQFDLVGLLKVENQNLCKIPFIHSGGSSKRFLLVSSPVFTANVGLKSNISSGYLNTNWIESVDGVKAQKFDASLGAYSQGSTNVTIGVSDSSVGFGQSSLIYPNYSASGYLTVYLHAFGGDRNQYTIPTTNGLYAGRIYDSAGTKYVVAIKNGISNPVPTEQGEFLSNQAGIPYFVCCRNSDGSPAEYSNTNISFFFASSGSIDQAKLNTFVNMLLL